MKRSDQKQRDNAFDDFYSSMKELMAALEPFGMLTDQELSVDDLNKITVRVKKLTKTVTQITESIGGRYE